MKSKLFRIFGVMTTVAVLVSMLSIASVTAVSTPSIILTAQGAGVAYTISSTNIYTTTFTAGAAVLAGGKINIVFPATTNLTNMTPVATSTGGAFNLPDIGQSFKITAAAVGDVATVTFTTGAATGVMSGLGTYVGGVATFAAVSETLTLTATAAASGTWARTTGLPTAALVSTLGTGATSNVRIVALTGIGGGPIDPLGAPTNAAYTVSGTYPAAQTLSITVPANGIGSGSLVQIIIGTTTGVINPSAAGSYTFTVATTTGATPAVTIEAAATSAAYTIINPVLVTPPGVVSVYNPAGVLMSQTVGANTLAAAVASIGVAGYTITLGPGVYSEPLNPTITVPAAATGLTIKASGAVADTIVPVNWTILPHDVTFKGLTLETSTAGLAGTVITVDAGSDNFTADTCTFVRSGDATSTGAQTFVVYNNATALGVGTLTGCTFDSTLAAVGSEIQVNVAATAVGLTVKGSTFKMDLDSTTYASDYGIVTAGGSAAVPIMIGDGNTFTGTANFGKAIKVTGGVVTINKNTFTGVKEAVWSTGGTTKFTNNTVDASGYAYTTTSPTLADYPFPIDATAGFTAFANKITNSKYYVAKVVANANLVHFNLDDLTGSTMGFLVTDAANTLDASHNWWGAATGPSTAVDYNKGLVDVTNYLGAAPSNGAAVYATNALDAKATVGTIVSLLKAGAPATAAGVGVVGTANFATNPGAVAPSSTLTGPKYFDVFVDGSGDADTVRILFYGSIKSDSVVYFYSSFASAWTPCTGTVNTTAGFVSVDVTAASTPSLLDLAGLPFVLAEGPPAAPGTTPSVQSPALGAVNIPIDTTFTWPAVAGAVSYEFEIAEEIGQTDKFYLKDEVGSSAVSAFKLVDTLKYDTQYWWRVRAVNTQGLKGAFTTSFFTTAKEPVVVVPTPPVVVTTNPPPQITLEIPPAQVTKVEPIPAYLLWAVIAVGAILVIAVIVLIVRTRRIS